MATALSTLVANALTQAGTLVTALGAVGAIGAALAGVVYVASLVRR